MGMDTPPARADGAGKLGALIVQSLRENAKAGLEVESSPGHGMRVTIVFTRAASAPAAD
jgi:signal transduction histidine kinase